MALGLREPKIHHRNEALPTGKHPCLAVIALEDRQRFVNRGGGVVFEFGRLHAAVSLTGRRGQGPPFAAASATNFD